MSANIEDRTSDELERAAPTDPYEDEPEPEEVSEQNINELIEQAKDFQRTHKEFTSKSIYENKNVYLISSRWLKRWKKYVSYEEVISGNPTSKLIGCGQLPIVNEDIVDLNAKFSVKFSELQYSYLNNKLKDELIEGKDFQFISEETWQIISRRHKKYKFLRKVADGPDGKIIEVYYQKIVVIPLIMNILKDIEQERISKLKQVTFQFSKYATIQQFKKIAGKAIKQWVEHEQRVSIDYEDYIKLWKMPQKVRKPILLNTFLQGCKANPSFTYKLFIEGQLLEDSLKISDIDIVTETIIVAQLKQFRENWVFFNLKHKLKASCSYCKKEDQLSFVCSCKYAVYCSRTCKQHDKSHHKYRCPNEAESDEEQKQLQLIQNSKRGLTGLRNLGNTCFMNSGLQCLSHIKELTDYFLTNLYVPEINTINNLGTHGQLASQYAKMIKKLWYGTDDTFSPNHLKKSIAKFQPMFSGYSQHDSGQLITYLLDGLHEDLNRVVQKPYIESKDYDGRPDEVIAKQAWEFFLKRNRSIIVDIFYGQFRSEVQCPKQQCGNISITFDPFSVCSLPLVDNSKKKLELTFVKDYIYSKKVYLPFTMQKDYTLQQKLDELKTIIGVDQSKRLVVYVSSFSSAQIINLKEPVNNIKKQYNYRTIYVRELNDYENPQKDIKIMVTNVVNNKYYSGETYRKNISPYHIFFVNLEWTNKQVYHKLIGYFSRLLGKKIENAEEFYKEYIDIEENSQIFRILTIPTSKYYSCSYCGKKQCSGCKIPYTDELFKQYIHHSTESEYDREKRYDIELYWRQEEKIIEKIYDQIKEENDSKFESLKEISFSISQASGTRIQDCIRNFSKEETLNQQNAWYCPKCKDFVLAKKQMKLYKVPKIFILCLKRFKRKDYLSQKISTLVNFPLEGLDLTQFVSNSDLPEEYFKNQHSMDIEGKNVMYDLIGISNHFGSTGGGHYTAYCKDPTSNQWFDFDDSSVTKLRSSDDVITESAYILFYKRRMT